MTFKLVCLSHSPTDSCERNVEDALSVLSLLDQIGGTYNVIVLDENGKTVDIDDLQREVSRNYRTI